MKLELRALPITIEQRNLLIDEAEGILKRAQEEERLWTEGEEIRFNELKSEIKKMNEMLRAQGELDGAEDFKPISKEQERAQEEQDELEVRAFEEFVRGVRAAEPAVNLKAGDNGKIIPSKIANKIVETAEEYSGLYGMVSHFNYGGDLSFPVYTEGITANYYEEGKPLIPTKGNFDTKVLKDLLIGAETLVSRALLNRTDIPVWSFVARKLGEAFARFFEKEIISGAGTAGKMEGIAKNISNKVDLAAITTDGIIDAQMKLKQVYQGKASWILSRDTLTAVYKLKDGNGQYVLNPDLRNSFGWNLLGRPVYCSDFMDKAGKDKFPIFYGDMTGYYLKFAQELQIDILHEVYAENYAKALVGWAQADGKVVETEKIVLVKTTA